MPFHGVKSDCKKGALEAQAFSDSPAGTPSSRMKYRRRLLGVASNLTSFQLGNPQEPTQGSPRFHNQDDLLAALRGEPQLVDGVHVATVGPLRFE